jgi:hypothetical protein
MHGKSGSGRVLEGLSGEAYDSLFHLGCLWTLVLFGVGGGIAMYAGLFVFYWYFVVILT